ncbi:MAG: pyridoxal phosphate-dependent aminotransferase [Proteocatella sp.]
MAQIKHGADTNEIKSKYGLEKLVDYSSNVNIFSPSGVDSILASITSSDLNYYLDINYTDLRTRISNRYNLEKENVILGNGSTEIMFLIMRLEYIKKVGIISPTFGEYERAARLAGKEVVDLFYNKDFSINIAQIEENIKDIDLLVICNPNNPSGNINDLEKIIEICKTNNKLLMVDETFIEFSDLEKSYTALNYLDRYDKIIVIRAVTKFYALTSVRLGYGFSGENIIRDLWAIKEPWTINIFAEKLVEVIYDCEFLRSSRDFYKDEIQRFIFKLREIDEINVYDTVTNFILIEIKNGKTSNWVKEYMIKYHGILIRDCSNFKGLNESFIRINIKDKEANDNFLRCFKDGIYN